MMDTDGTIATLIARQDFLEKRMTAQEEVTAHMVSATSEMLRALALAVTRLEEVRQKLNAAASAANQS